jgi:hypothetical protein
MDCRDWIVLRDLRSVNRGGLGVSEIFAHAVRVNVRGRIWVMSSPSAVVRTMRTVCPVMRMTRPVLPGFFMRWLPLSTTTVMGMSSVMRSAEPKVSLSSMLEFRVGMATMMRMFTMWRMAMPDQLSLRMR